MTTKVIFRKWYNDDSIHAVFPELPHSHIGCTMVCYAHCGQHGECRWRCMLDKTTPATPEEYAPLLKELKAVGYDDLEICKKVSYKIRKAFRVNQQEYRKLDKV